MKKEILILILPVALAATTTFKSYSQEEVKQVRDTSAKQVVDTSLSYVRESRLKQTQEITIKQVQVTPIKNLQDTILQKVMIIKNDGSSYTGVIISRDEREILIETGSLGRLYIPLHEIKDIIPVKESVKNKELFATRYFLTTNGLSLGAGNRYYMLSFYGPEAHFAVGDNFSVGIMTSWLAMPIIGSAKLSVDADENFHLGLGLLAGTLSWAQMSAGGVLPYGCVTIGNYVNNFTFSAGYAMITSESGTHSAPLLSPACIFKIARDVYFVMDTFIYLGEESVGIIMPGLRFIRPQKRSSFQFGFGGVAAEGELVPMPVPVCSWFFEF